MYIRVTYPEIIYLLRVGQKYLYLGPTLGLQSPGVSDKYALTASQYIQPTLGSLSICYLYMCRDYMACLRVSRMY